VFIFVESESTVQIDQIDDSFLFEDTLEYKRLGEILVERRVISEDDLKPLLQSQKRIGEVLVEHHIATEEQVEAAFDEQQHMRRLQDRKQQEFAASSIRVKSERLDTLVDLVGELVTVRAGLTQTASTVQSNELTRLVEQTERLISELRDVAMGIRMVPIGTTFRKFKRLVRDLSEDLHKQAEFVTAGGETELDKTVIDRLNDPLVHLIRNSLDHGVETPEQRRAAGKPEAGTIRLSAEHSGASVIISVEDDGAGIDPERVRQRAVAKGLLAADAELPESELFQLLFAPGFSTAESVTNVSGRGVGMDVVKKEIDSLGGSVSVESSPGRGSKMMLKIPLTLAIIEGLLVRIGDEHFVLPLSAVEECVELSNGARKEAGKQRILNIRGEVLPYVRLRDLFEIDGEHPEIEQIVIVKAYEGRVGFVVDTVIGDHQTVIKPLGRMYKDVEGLSGATILGDGSVALILDVQRLTRVAVDEDRDAG
jgi:two-component system chemotaxis sensor kinase CheA